MIETIFAYFYPPSTNSRFKDHMGVALRWSLNGGCEVEHESLGEWVSEWNINLPPAGTVGLHVWTGECVNGVDDPCLRGEWRSISDFDVFLLRCQ